MKYFYSPKTSGFYIDEINSVMPDDAIEVSKEDYTMLLDGQAKGKVIVYKSRKVQLADPVPQVLTWDDIRSRREYYLTSSDWTQIPDNALSDEARALWKTYRQALRDVTETYRSPDLVVWPSIPNTK